MPARLDGAYLGANPDGAFRAKAIGISANPCWAPGTIGLLFLATVVTAIPVILHLTGIAAGMAACVVMALLVANFATPAVPILLIYSYVFQNLFVSLVSPAIADFDQFNSIRGYNFVLTTGTWLVIAWKYWTNRAAFDRRFCAIMDVTSVVLLAVGAFFLLGTMSNPSGAIVYLRNVVAPFLLFQIFAVVAYQYRVSITVPLISVASLALLYGYLELFAHDSLFHMVNGETYIDWRLRESYEAGVWLKELRETGRVIRSFRDTMLIDFLNTPIFRGSGLQVYRILGPNFHFISFAYVLAVFCIILLSIGRWWYLLIALPLLVVTGSKGALILAIFVTVAIAATLRFRGHAPMWTLGAALTVYAVVGVAMGIAGADYHVIGFISGVNSLLTNPIGRGLGVGGNLAVDAAAIDWSQAQHLGEVGSVVESAVGVLLNQMGVFAFVPLFVLLWLSVMLWNVFLHSGQRPCAVTSFAILTVMINGIFQEEALFAPLAMGMVLAFAGLLLGRAYRLGSSTRRSGV